MANAYNSGVQQPEPPAFILVPINSAAKRATEHVRNKYYQFPLENDTFGLWIGFTVPEHLQFTLGRRDSHIYLPNDAGSRGSPQISDLQASFDLVPETGAVLLRDHSRNNNTETFPPSSNSDVSVTVKFRPNSRSVLVARGINSRVAFGREKYYQFELRWQSLGLYAFDSDQPYTVGPRKSSVKKYIEAEKIGGGAYGEVLCVLDITTGLWMAVKKFHHLNGKNLEFATREVANLFKINKNKAIQHEHILEIFDSAGGGKDDNWGEIFMPLMSGNLKTLIEMSDRPPDLTIADTVLQQMLLALQCIASHRIVHRDIKPENILWQLNDEGGYHFCLGDFGLSHDPNLARTVAGTEPFMAPEVYHRKPQSTKVDIWSLFATVVWVRNTDGFRHNCSRYSAPDIHRWLVKISMMPEYANIRTMASMQPKKRPSAEQQIAILSGELEVYEDYQDADGTGSYPGMGGQFPDDLTDRFGGIHLDDSGYGNGPESGDSGNAPEMPYYEPYTTGLMEEYPWEEQGQAGPSDKYMPRVPRQQQNAFVAPYANPYAPAVPPEAEDDSATAVPDTGTWTARPFMTEEEPVYQRDVKRKGKDDKYYRR